MLTRAFLLLLAMMTGLSAAQAADGQRPTQGAALAAAATVLAASNAIGAEEARSPAHAAFVTPDHRLVASNAPSPTTLALRVVAIRLSDRLRA